MQGTWIWCDQQDTHGYNQTMMARRSFALPACGSATLAITADSRYRLFVNGEWVNDGPARAWPEHYSYDLLDLTPYLREGVNELRVIANYYGIGTFHQVPRQAGLLAWLEATASDGELITLGTDSDWEAAPVAAWISNTPKISIQMGPVEVIDARRMNRLDWAPAKELHAAGEGPWGEPRARDVALLSRDPVSPVACTGMHRLAPRDALTVSFNMVQILHPRRIEANRWISHAGALVTTLSVPADAAVVLELEECRMWLDGAECRAGLLSLSSGDHLLVLAPQRVFSHDRVQSMRLLGFCGLALADPRGEGGGHWRLLRFPGLSEYVATDHVHDDAAECRLREGWEEALAGFAELTDAAALDALGERLSPLPPSALLADPYPDFAGRRVVGGASSRVDGPEHLLVDNAACTRVHPEKQAPIELVLDLGEQRCGYWELDLVAAEGTVIDLAAVEYITPDGTIQPTDRNRNVMRIVADEGRNHIVSMRRRSGRYLFLTLRNQDRPVEIRLVRVIESLYPVQAAGGFRASDARLNEIWEISARTLKLCMEDTFVDCPLYEQTLWIGDARNEALFAYTAFGAPDIARRCIRLGGESLERYPMVGSQVPSSWDIVLPAWSFLWAIGVWDHYLYTGDREWLAETAWPWMMENLRGAATYTTDEGLFSGPLWNLLDWSGIDQGHETVTHNTLLAIGAVDAALRCADCLDAESDAAWLRAYRERLRAGAERMWQPDRQAYADSIRDDGSISPSSCQHNSALALLYDAAPAERHELLLGHLIDPPEGMVRVGSPFAIQYIYEALEKMGRHDVILRSIYDNYLPMLEAGATTVWETFPDSPNKPGQFPTRSHCHAWSSAPIYFLNRMVLGLRPQAPGGTHWSVSPRPGELGWASGASATPHGPLHVQWRRQEGTLLLVITTPAGVTAEYEGNGELEGLEVQVTQRRG